MHIALSTSVMQRGKSGVGQYVLALAQAMLRHADEHEFSLFVLEEDMPLFHFAHGKMGLIPVAEKWRPAVKNIGWHQAILPGLLRGMRADVLHVPSYRRMLGTKPCALVSTIHDLAPFHVRGKYDLARMLYGRVAVKWLARRQDEIIAVSTSTAVDIRRFFGIPLDRQNVVLNGVDHERFTVGDAEAARIGAKACYGLDAPFFLYVSRLEHPAKNHVRLIEAFNAFKQATNSPWLLALGGSDWHGASAIHAAAQASPFAKDIRFLGFVPDEVLPDLYRAAHAMVYPSLFEGFGLPPIEAMACGCPVVSSARGALQEVIGDAALRIDPDRVASISGGLARIASSPELRRDLVARGLANARRFDWNTNADRVLEVYRRAIDARRAPRRKDAEAAGEAFLQAELHSPGT
ncbi:MAG: glycosyltransferase family 4 protein [Roseimicrobium sp.]